MMNINMADIRKVFNEETGEYENYAWSFDKNDWVLVDDLSK